MEKEILNRENVYETFYNLFKEVVEDYGYDLSLFEDYVEEYTIRSTENTLESMKKYCHKKDTRMSGNFCNIREDWEYTYDFIGSEVKPWGKFDDVIKSIDDGTISDEDLEKFQTWVFDWYFRAFGTWGLKYNFGEFIGEIAYEFEREGVLETA